MYTMFPYAHNKILNEISSSFFGREGELKNIAGNFYAWVKVNHVSSYRLPTKWELFPLWMLGPMNEELELTVWATQIHFWLE